MKAFENIVKKYLKPEERLVFSYKEIYVQPPEMLRGSVIV